MLSSRRALCCVVGAWMAISGGMGAAMHSAAAQQSSPSASATREQSERTATAQRLPSAIITTQSALSPEQSRVLNNFISQWARMLREGDTEAVIAARKHLLQPIYSPQATSVFKRIYSAQLLPALAPLVQSEEFLPRLNAMIVIASLRTPQVIDVVLPVLTDENPAIRLWAAKALARAMQNAEGGGPSVPIELQQRVLATLKKIMPRETSNAVLEQMYLVMGRLSIPDAFNVLIQTLNARLAAHRADLDLDIRVDLRGLMELQRQMALRDLTSPKAKKQFRKLLVVTGKYAKVLARAFKSDTVPAAVAPVAEDFINGAYSLFRVGLAEFDQGFPPGPNLTRTLKRRQYNQLLKGVYAWVGRPGAPGVLSRSNIDIPLTKLLLTPLNEAPQSAPRTVGTDGQSSASTATARIGKGLLAGHLVRAHAA